MDNFANFGKKEDELRPARKSRGGKPKPWKIECRIRRSVNDGLARTLGLRDWWTAGRYTTAARRDQALAVMVKKEAALTRTYFRSEYRAVDP